MIVFSHFIYNALHDFFLPPWHKEVRLLSREVVYKLLEDSKKVKAQASPKEVRLFSREVVYKLLEDSKKVKAQASPKEDRLFSREVFDSKKDA